MSLPRLSLRVGSTDAEHRTENRAVSTEDRSCRGGENQLIRTELDWDSGFYRGSFWKAQLGFGQGLVQQLFNLFFVLVFGQGKLANKQVAGPLQHLLLPEGQRLSLVQNRQAFEDGGHIQQGTGTHTFRVLFEAVLPIGVVIALPVVQEVQYFLDFPIPHHPPEAHRVDVAERHHHLETTGLNLEQVELLHGGTDGPAADLLDNTYAVIGVDNLITDVEGFTDHHEGHPRGQA